MQITDREIPSNEPEAPKLALSESHHAPSQKSTKLNIRYKPLEVFLE
jgi:hypothetical protein